MRVFPQSDDGHDIVRVFEQMFAKVEGVRVLLHEKIEKIERAEKAKKAQEEKEENNLFRIITDKGTYEVERVVLTTGGSAYRHTGSTGDGYAFAQSLGHNITAL